MILEDLTLQLTPSLLSWITPIVSYSGGWLGACAQQTAVELAQNYALDKKYAFDTSTEQCFINNQFLWY